MSSLETNATYNLQRPNNVAAHITKGQLWARVLYKESKPLIPLLLSLTVLSLLGHILVEIQRVFNSLDVMFHAIPYALNPILFALGAAALLVSQEKEQRTLLWYSSLPIAPRTIVQSKIFVGLVGIALSWLVSFCIALPFSQEVLRVRAESPTDILYVFPMTAFFIFGVTFSLTWICGAAIPALLCLIPVVLATILTASIITNLVNSDSYVSRDVYTTTTPITWLISYSVAIAVVGLVAWRTGSRSFVAPGGKRVKQSAATGLSYRSKANFFYFKRSGETGALLWQAWMQNRAMTVAMIITAFASWFFVANGGNSGVSAVLTSFSVGSYALLVCWVGTMAFGADQHLRRVHFLAERGISPIKVWVSRLVVPFGVLAVLALTILSLELFTDRSYQHLPQTMLVSCALAALWSLIAISIAQWWGQLGFSRVVSLCGAPLSVVLLIAYYTSIVSMIFAPVWLVLLMLPIPFLATRFSMRDWMDRRFTTFYYGRHASFLIFAVVVPLLPLAFQIATVPRMSSANYRLYTREYQQDVTSNPETGWASAWRFESLDMPFQIPVLSYEELIEQKEANSNVEGGVDAEANLDRTTGTNSVVDATLQEVDQGVGLEGYSGGMGGYAQDGTNIEAMQREYRLKALKEMPPLEKVMDELVTQFAAALESNPAPLRYSLAVEQIATASLQATYAVSLNPDSEELQKRWEKSVDLLGKITNRLRKSRTLLDQNHADNLEKTLLRILQTDTSKQRLDKALYRTLANQLADSESRIRDRRRALLHSWKYDTHERLRSPDSAEFYQQLGGVSLYGFRNVTIVKQTLLADSIRSYVVDLLLQFNSSRESSSQQAIVTKLDNILPPASRKQLIGDWHGDWEKQAESLTQSN